MDWHDLIAAFALYLVLEGILPFLNPPSFRRFTEIMAQMDDSSIRRFGGISMAAGIILLFIVR